jgi:hypothetical protein
MRSTRNLLTLVSAILAFAVLAPQPSQAQESRESKGSNESRTLTLTKECGTATLAPGELGYCTVIASNFRPLRGAKIRYFGPGFRTDTHPFLDSWVVIEGTQGGGGTAFGHCLLRTVPDALGACQFTGGSGSLKGFKADVTVTAIGGPFWHWDGAGSIDD